VDGQSSLLIFGVLSLNLLLHDLPHGLFEPLFGLVGL